uniref:Uncharacterized protein n=1 Tax=Oryza brachyantha TaxID=4533 RepID=J3LQ44_ORYBR
MASQDAAPQCRPGSRAATDSSASVSAEEFEFCVLPSGGLALSGGEEDAMCFADEVFSDGKLLPLRLSSANSVDAAALRLIRSDSLDGATTASARFEQPSSAAKDTVALDKKLPLGFLGTGLVCNCSPDAVEPVGSAEVAAAARRRRRMAEEKNTRKVKNGQSTVRRSRILEWLEDLSISKDKNAA